MLRRQILKRQNRSRDHMPQRVHEEIRTLSAIEAGGHFVEVGG